jgi:hypothetical protein
MSDLHMAIGLAAGSYDIADNPGAKAWTFTPTDPDASGMHYAWRDDHPSKIAVFPGSGTGGLEPPEYGVKPLGMVDLEEAGEKILAAFDLVMPTDEKEAGAVIARLEAEARMLRSVLKGEPTPPSVVSMN